MSKKIVFITLNKNGLVSSRKSAPDLRAGQIVIKLKINVPDACFSAYPTAELDLDENSIVGDGMEINASKMSSYQLSDLQKGIKIELAERIEYENSEKWYKRGILPLEGDIICFRDANSHVLYATETGFLLAAQAYLKKDTNTTWLKFYAISDEVSFDTMVFDSPERHWRHLSQEEVEKYC